MLKELNINNIDDNFFMKYEQKYFDSILNKISFTEGEINSLETNGRARKKYEIVKMILARFGIKMMVESKRRLVDSKRQSIRTYKIIYDINVCNLIYCKIFNNNSDYSSNFVKYITCFSEYDKFIKKKIILKKLF